MAWSSGNAENAAKFYAKSDGLVFYDAAPFSYTGWKEYAAGVQKEFLDSAANVSLTAGKDLKVTRRGNIAWTTVPMHLSEKVGRWEAARSESALHGHLGKTRKNLAAGP